jgi:hypothetical protein
MLGSNGGHQPVGERDRSQNKVGGDEPNRATVGRKETHPGVVSATDRNGVEPVERAHVDLTDCAEYANEGDARSVGRDGNGVSIEREQLDSRGQVQPRHRTGGGCGAAYRQRGHDR